MATEFDLKDSCSIISINPTWRIIPIRKWLGSPPFISHEVRPFVRGPTTLLRGLTITMVINHLLTGILQVYTRFFQVTPSWSPFHWGHIFFPFSKVRNKTPQVWGHAEEPGRSCFLFSRWWFHSHFFYFHPDPWGNAPIWRAYFSEWLKPPTSFYSWFWVVFIRVTMKSFKIRLPRNQRFASHARRMSPKRFRVLKSLAFFGADFFFSSFSEKKSPVAVVKSRNRWILVKAYFWCQEWTCWWKKYHPKEGFRP